VIVESPGVDPDTPRGGKVDVVALFWEAVDAADIAERKGYWFGERGSIGRDEFLAEYIAWFGEQGNISSAAAIDEFLAEYIGDNIKRDDAH
jgi:hypothetical protein